MGRPRVYLSSTRKDLIPYREAVRTALASIGDIVCVSMESGTAEEHPPLETCLHEVRSCDLYVGLFAYRYGFIPPGQTQSITRLEYDQAGAANIDRLIFIAQGPWETSFIDSITREGDGGNSIQQFREELALAHTVAYFNTPHELALNVVAAVHEWLRKQPPPPPPPPPPDPRLVAYLEDCISRETDRELDVLYVPMFGFVGAPSIDKLLPRPVRVRTKSSRGEVRVEEKANIVEAVAEYGRAVLVGDPGSGKSTTLHYLHIESAKRALDSNGPVPLFINLAEWPATTEDFKTLLVQERDARGCPHLPASRFILLLDGLNELGEQHYDARIASIQKWMDDNSTTRIVLTSREQQYLQGRQLDLPIVTIRPFTEPQIEEFVQRHLGDDAPGLLAAIGWDSRERGGSRHLARLAENPFQLLLMCVVYRERRSLPSTRGELLRILVQQSYERERDKGRHCNLTYDEMLDGFGRLALRAVQERSATAIEETKAARGIGNYEQLRTLGVNMNLLRRTKDNRFIQFAHQLVLEYFAAERLVAGPNRLERVVRKPRFTSGGRRAQRSDEMVMTFAELAPDAAGALLTVSRIDPFIAADTLAQSERLSAVEEHTRVQIARELLRFREAGGETLITRIRHLGDAGIGPLAEVLAESANKSARRFAVRAIGAIESMAAIENLFAARRDADKWVRRDAEAELRRIAEQRRDLADAFLAQKLPGYDGNARDQLVRLLSPRAEETQLAEVVAGAPLAMSVEEAVEAVLRSQAVIEKRLNGQAARLELNGPPKDVKVLVDGEVRRRGANPNLPEEPTAASPFRFVPLYADEVAAQEAWQAILDRDDPLQFATFAKFARSPNSKTRSYGVLGLFHCGEAGRDHALQYLDNLVTPFRVDVVRGYTLARTCVDAPTIERLLEDKSADVRHMAIKGLLRVDPAAALDVLRRMLHSRITERRVFALQYLWSCFAEVEGRAVHALMREDHLPRVRHKVDHERLEIVRELSILLRTSPRQSQVPELAAMSLFLLFDGRADLLAAAFEATALPGTQNAQ